MLHTVDNFLAYKALLQLAFVYKLPLDNILCISHHAKSISAPASRERTSRRSTALSDGMRTGEVAARLAHIDWDFASAPPSSDVHVIHPYPAKFIPQIPRHLIELFPPDEGTAVLDPFCGSGTSLVEAVRLGLDAIGIDLNPLACLIARVKTGRLPPGFGSAIRRVGASARSLARAGSVTIPTIPRLDHWFLPDVQIALAALISSIDAEEETDIRNALRVALSSIIVQVSNQESDTRYAAIDKNVDVQTVFEKFDKAVKNVAGALLSIQDSLFARLGQATVFNQDTLSVTPDQIPATIGLVITSPPYPNAYEYWLYHKYRMYWLGMDPLAVRAREIGARPHYFKTNHQNEHDFEKQMRTTFEFLFQVMKPRAKACFLVGRSIIHGRVIDNVALLERAAEGYFGTSGIVSRSIRKTRKAFNLAHAKIDTEHLIIFTRR